MLSDSEISELKKKLELAKKEVYGMIQTLDERIKKFFSIIENDKDNLYVFSTQGIGDFIMAGGLSYAVQKRKNKKSTILVIEDRKKDTGILFPNVSGIISLPIETVSTLRKYANDNENYEGDNWIYSLIHKHDDEYIWDTKLNMLDRLKKDVLKIPLDSPFVYPVIDKIPDESAAAIQEKYILDKERTIILLPHAVTFKNLNLEFWEKIAQRLKEKSYIVYTNVAGAEKPIEGTEPLKVSFAELYFVSDKIKCFIGTNSGVFIFLAMTNAKILNVTPFPNWFWDISILFPECNNHTFYDTTKYISDLKDSLGKFDISINVAKCAHKEIPQEDIFYSHSEIIEKILSEVEKI